MSNPPSPVKQPLAFNSPRASPFRRPESPVGRSPTVRAATPQGSPLKQSTPTQPASKFASSQSHTPTLPLGTASATADRSWIKPRETSPTPSPSKSPIPFQLSSGNLGREMSSPAHSTATARQLPSRTVASTNFKGSNDPLSSVPPHHLHTMRESFSVLDRSNNGQITPGDVATALSELGLDSSPSTLSTYFPPGTPSLNLGAYLNLLARDLAQLSRQDELMAAFSAFDDDDSGQVDVAELRDAVLHTAPDGGASLKPEEVDAVLEGFVGRRVLKKGQVNAGLGGKKEVFRYGDFVTGVWGGNGSKQGVQN